MPRFFRIYFAGVVKSEHVMGGGEAVKAAFGGGERVEGRAAGIDQAGEEFGSDRFARIMRSDEIEDGVVVEGGVLGRSQGGQGPVEDGLPGGVMARLVETEQFAKRSQGAVRGLGADGFGEDLLDLIEEEGGEAGVDGPAGAGDGGVPGAAGVEGPDGGGGGRGGEMGDGGPIVRVPGGAEVDARRPGVEEAAAFHGFEAVADLTDGRERDAEFGAAVEDPVLHGWGLDCVVVVGGA